MLCFWGFEAKIQYGRQLNSMAGAIGCGREGVKGMIHLVSVML